MRGIKIPLHDFAPKMQGGGGGGGGEGGAYARGGGRICGTLRYLSGFDILVLRPCQSPDSHMTHPLLILSSMPLLPL